MNKRDMLFSVTNYISCFAVIGKNEERILEALDKIDRADFMSAKFKSDAYVDSAMPIENGQTISQPSTVARMLQLLKVKPGESVLEVGTGSGWNAALIAFIVGVRGTVVSLEVFEELIRSAQQKIQKYHFENVHVYRGDFRKFRKNEKFDKITITAGIEKSQEPIIESFAIEHLKENGILVCPRRIGPLMILEKNSSGMKKTYTKEEYVFVPLILE